MPRYAVESALVRFPNIVIRASDFSVTSSSPSSLLDSHLILIYAPSEPILREIALVVGRIPIAVIGPERYKSTADVKLFSLLQKMPFHADPLQHDDAKLLYNIARQHAAAESSSFFRLTPVAPSSDQREVEDKTSLQSTQVKDINVQSTFSVGSSSASSIPDSSASTPGAKFDLEDIDDVVDNTAAYASSFEKSSSKNASEKSSQDLSIVLRRLNERYNPRSRRGRSMSTEILGDHYQEHETHGEPNYLMDFTPVKIKLRELGGYATKENCSEIAHACGLPKCAGTLLFRIASESENNMELITPETGVPCTNTPAQRLSSEAFLVYWNSRMKSYDGEERLAHILEDYHMVHANETDHTDIIRQHSCSSPPPRRTRNSARRASLDSVKLASISNCSASFDLGGGLGDSVLNLSDTWCPCDSGIGNLIVSFMDSRKGQFGHYALVKMAEAIAIGTALVLHEIRGVNSNKVGGRARPVCAREVKESKLNAALIAAEAGIFDGVTKGLSINLFRSIKRSFMGEISTPRTSGCALSVMLSVEEVVGFCLTQKTLLPRAVRLAMYAHCRNAVAMTLSEFSILLRVLNNLECNGTVDYMFTVVDVDQNGKWTKPDLLEFHKEKERLWHDEGMALSDFNDAWLNLVDMLGDTVSNGPRTEIRRRDLLSLGPKGRKAVLQSVLFVDDNCSSLQIRKTMELNKNSKSTLKMI